jgi:predicted lipase
LEELRDFVEEVPWALGMGTIVEEGYEIGEEPVEMHHLEEL